MTSIAVYKFPNKRAGQNKELIELLTLTDCSVGYIAYVGSQPTYEVESVQAADSVT